MADGQPEENIPLEDLTPEEANRIIHSHRKVRYGTACWPCRQRKVKCDNKQPCENCFKREHPQLCSYRPNKSAPGKHSSNGTPEAGKKRAFSMSESADETSRKAERSGSWPRSLDLSANLEDSDSVENRYLGQNSIPSLLQEQSDSGGEKQDSADIRKDMRSIFGLDNSAPFPLMSSQHLQKLTHDIAHELPSDREVMKLFRTYKEIPQPFWGFVIDIDDLEAKLMVYLESRSSGTGNPGLSSKVSAAWLGILFAVLAVGSQYHESPYHVRTRDAQKYMQISFHFLRLGNFLLRPSLDSIQAMLLISFVLLNDMKAEGSWALTGLTCRLAQSLGLHRPNTRASSSSLPEAQKKEMIRRKIWWTCVWHDTLTSLSFDRSPMTNFTSCPIPVRSESPDGDYSYLETMYHLIEIISRRLNPDTVASATYDEIVSNCEAVEILRSRAAAHIQNKDKCKTAVDRLQHFAIRLHTSFVISVCCRPALRRDCSFDAKQKAKLADKCKFNLTETVRMFLFMHQLSVIPTRSWAFTYHGLSSALLLGILCETKADPEVRQLQGDLIAALSATAAKDVHSPVINIVQTDKDIELSGPLHRALTALRNIYDHGTIIGTRLSRELESAQVNGSDSGSRTPLPSFNHLTQQPASMFRGMSSQGAAVSDPRENAALAMAEMQNGGATLNEFSGLPFSGSVMSPSLDPDALAPPINIDPQYMAPLDLYDSIWGESPDPWNPVDPLNYEFLAQPPPGQSQQQFYF